MPKCSNCDKIQGRLNKGGLCRACYLMDNTNASNSHDDVSSRNNSIHKNDYSQLSFHANVIEIADNLMKQERKMNDELHTILKEQISYLKNDIANKN